MLAQWKNCVQYERIELMDHCLISFKSALEQDTEDCLFIAKSAQVFALNVNKELESLENIWTSA